MEHKIWYDDEMKVVHLKIIGDYTSEDTLFLGKKCIELL